MPARKTILIVEDDPDTLEMLATYFQAQGYDVLTACMGEDALKICQETPPDLILQDIRLPDIVGYEVYRRLQRNLRTSRIPVIFLTELKERDDRITGLKLGAVDYITKPFDMQELRLRVRNIMRRAGHGSLVSPVTGLPETEILDDRLRSLLGREDWAVLYIRLANVKAFNDAYGFVAGDDALRAVGLIISNTLDEVGSMNDFVGHLSKSEFLVLTVPDRVTALRDKLTDRLGRAIQYFYPLQDREQVAGEGQEKVKKDVPALEVHIGVLVGDSAAFTSIREIKQAAKEAGVPTKA
ncbi:MAG: response regulator [Anaerolineae bacterium]|nr:response regulator [Anaerolineae bacterium]